jgi:PAS domain S-box-containing protein
MLSPLVLGPGLIFDGRSVMISLCGLFFGPVAVCIAGVMTIICRIIQGGAGTRMGVLVVLSSALVGLIFYRRQKCAQTEINSRQLWLFGLIVHAAMLLMALALPPELIISTLKKIGLPVLFFYPLATVLAGKILSDQEARSRFLDALRQGKEELQTTLYSIGDAVISTDTGIRIKQMNPAAEQLTGWSETDAKGLRLESVLRIINESTREPVENPAKLVLRLGEVVGLANHTLLVAKDGTERPIADSAAPIRSNNGTITGVVLVFRDQTKERAAAASLRESEERYRVLFHQAPLGYQSLDENGNFININQRWLETLGYSREEVTGKWFGDFLAPEYVELFRQRFPVFKIKGKIQTAFWMIHKDGSRRFISFDGRVGHNPDGSFKQTHCILSDITETKLAEDALHEAKRQWECTFDATNDAVCLLDKNQRIVRCNHAMASFSGLSKSDLIGKSCWEVVHKTPESIPDCPVQKMVLSGKREWAVLQIRNCWYEVTADPLLDDEGRLEGAVHIVRDITARKLVEENLGKLENQLLQSQKMEAIGRLASGVAHDFNNMLQVILGRTEMLLRVTPQEKSLTEISKAAQRSADLTRQLLAFARKQTIAPQVVDINESISVTLSILRRLIGENIDLRWTPSAQPLQIKIDPAQLSQILTNLTVNARDAIKGTGWIRIETGKAIFDEDYCKMQIGFIPGTYARLIVSDSGYGMDKETSAHIFEPFFTTKSVGEGSGLGLATLYGIVRQNGGFVNIYSEIGKGTAFKIYLPLCATDSHIHGQITPPVEPPPPHGKETILFVEDEKTLLSLGRMQLQKLGYTVLSSNLPAEALRLAGDYNGEIHLLITDVVMPEMSGLELSQKIVAQRPQIKCLFVSGYTADIITHHGILDDKLNFLQKPFSSAALAEKIREVLSAP